MYHPHDRGLLRVSQPGKFMAYSPVKAFFTQYRSWSTLEWICLAVVFLSIIILLVAAPSSALAICAGLLNFVGACWLATGVFLNASAIASLAQNTAPGLVAATFKGASDKVWLAVLYFGGAVIVQALSIF